MHEAWSSLNSASDSDSPPPSLISVMACMDDIADLFGRSNESEDKDDNWNLLDYIVF